MRTSFLMIAASVCLTVSSLQAGSGRPGDEQREMQALLEQMQGVPAHEHQLMEQAIMQSLPGSSLAVDPEQSGLLQLLEQMSGLPERERQLMQQAIMQGSVIPAAPAAG